MHTEWLKKSENARRFYPNVPLAFCPSVSLSHAGIMSKQCNYVKYVKTRMIRSSLAGSIMYLVFSNMRFINIFANGNHYSEALYETGVCQSNTTF